MAARSLNPLSWSRRTQLTVAVSVGAATACALAALVLYRRRRAGLATEQTAQVSAVDGNGRPQRVGRLSGDVPEHLKAVQAECVALIETRSQLEQEGNWAGVEETLRKLQQIIGNAVGDTDDDYMRADDDIAYAQIMQGKFEEANRLRKQALLRGLKLFGEDEEVNKMAAFALMEMSWYLEPKGATETTAGMLAEIAHKHGSASMLTAKAISYVADMYCGNGDTDRAMSGYAKIVEICEKIIPPTDESMMFYVDAIIRLNRAMRMQEELEMARANYQHLQAFVTRGAVPDALAYQITADICAFEWDAGSDATARALQATLLGVPLHGHLGFSRYLSTLFVNARPVRPEEADRLRGVLSLGLMINFSAKHLAQVAAGVTIDYMAYPTLYDSQGAIVQVTEENGNVGDINFDPLPLPPQRGRIYGFSLRLPKGIRFPRGKYLLELQVRDNTKPDRPLLGVHRQVVQSYFDE